MNLKVVSLIIVLFTSTLNAQNKKVSEGAKFQVAQVQNINNTSQMMGMDMQTIINSNADIVIEIKSVKDSTIILTATTKHITGSLSMMGQDEKFDSNDSSSASNPMAAPFLKDINKPKEFVLVNGNIVSGTNNGNEAATATGLEINISEIVGELFVSSKFKNKNEGFKWTHEDQSTDGKQKSVSIYTITKATGAAIEVTANTSQSSKGTTKMMNMDVLQNLTGIRTSVLSYDKESGILTSINQAIEMKGTAEAMGTAIPINTKGTIITTVK